MTLSTTAAAVRNEETAQDRQSDTVPLFLKGEGDAVAGQPITAGVPFPKGKLWDAAVVALGCAERMVPVQKQPLAWWSDGSVKWLLLDFVTPSSAEDLALNLSGAIPVAAEFMPLEVEELPNAFVIRAGCATFRVDRRRLRPLEQVSVGGNDLLQADGSSMSLVDARGRVQNAAVETSIVETLGPVRTTLRLEGKFPGRRTIRFVARLSFFTGSGLVRIDLTIHNPNRARHRGGLWDLGDPGSILFKDLSLQLSLCSAPDRELSWIAEPAQDAHFSAAADFELYQDSSGGENWNSKNHVNREGRVPCSFRGYRLRLEDQEVKGLRASPLVSLQNRLGGIAVAIPEFWQQFPKAIEVEGQTFRARLFPGQFNDLFELQGGEQKTHTVWLDFHAPTLAPCSRLQWVHQPATATAAPEWYATTGAIPHFSPAAVLGTPLDDLLDEAVNGENNLLARREIIDEYGWRNFGDLYADHEGAYYDGQAPVISHYNNQYDVLFGSILHFLRTGKLFWRDLFAPLARHVIDIDIYHTNQDKAAYNGGLFWHTDHYRDAATCTHRAYAKANQQPGQPYGGGPCNEHNYTTGLMHYYYLTGDPKARETVIGQADWVIHMDDGAKTILGLVEDWPTGAASRTREGGYHGPGRGCGNSINALIDGWLLTANPGYLDKAEELIRRSIHPSDDVEAHRLDDVEGRWSYTIYLSVLGRYLEIKTQSGQRDYMHAYAAASLRHCARWMVAHELPYFDHPEKLEFPTETWAAQELRKANVLRLAAALEEELLQSRMLERAEEFSRRSWADLLRFDSRSTTRPLALLLVEGLKENHLRQTQITNRTEDVATFDFGAPEEFVPQRQRVKDRLRSPLGLIGSLLHRFPARVWGAILGSRRKVPPA